MLHPGTGRTQSNNLTACCIPCTISTHRDKITATYLVPTFVCIANQKSTQHTTSSAAKRLYLHGWSWSNSPLDRHKKAHANIVYTTAVTIGDRSTSTLSRSYIWRYEMLGKKSRAIQTPGSKHAHKSLTRYHTARTREPCTWYARAVSNGSHPSKNYLYAAQIMQTRGTSAPKHTRYTEVDNERAIYLIYLICPR